jgi:hypothetical protein
MTDDERHDEVTQLLREQGPANAPPEIREEVMWRVHMEPRSRRSARRSWVTLLAAAAITIALIGGISRLGGGGSSSSSSTPQLEKSAGAGSAATSSAQPLGGTTPFSPYGPDTVTGVPRSDLNALVKQFSARDGRVHATAPPNRGVVKLYVPSPQFNALRKALQNLARDRSAASTHLVEVRLYRIP